MLAILLASGVWVVGTHVGGRKVTAYFTNASALFPDNQVMVLGVPVGSIDAITPEVVAGTWDTAALQVLDRIRTIGSLAALKAVSAGATAISPQNVYDAAATVQESSGTPLCPPEPPPL